MIVFPAGKDSYFLHSICCFWSLQVYYEDGDVELLFLNDERWKLIESRSTKEGVGSWSFSIFLL